jgi:hypothetical protein
MTINFPDGFVYESPDGGETIYARQVGSDERRLHYESEKVKSLHERLQEEKMWGEIRRLAKTNVPLADAVDKVIMIYNLVKDRK